MTAYHRIPSSVIALQYLADVETMRAEGLEMGAITLRKTSLVRRSIRECFDVPKAERYSLDLARMVERTQKVEAVKVEKPKRKPWQDARRHNERRMRDAILKVVGRHGWTAVGVRKLADLAGMKHRTARDILTRMAADGQVKLDTSWGQGKRTGVYVLHDHPCWSDEKHAQSLALSKLSDQLRG
jgi:hypothetical protein